MYLIIVGSKSFDNCNVFCGTKQFFTIIFLARHLALHNNYYVVWESPHSSVDWGAPSNHLPRPLVHIPSTSTSSTLFIIKLIY